MNIGVIDIEAKTLEYLKSKYGHLGYYKAVGCKEDDGLKSIAQKAVSGNYDAIAINIECKFEKTKRLALKGIELIFWLRLKENYLGTIITYGFLSAAQVIRLKPEYVVLNAPNNYHLRLPELQGLKSMQSMQNLTGINEYNKYLKPFINLEAIRHSSANYYALKNLSGIHKQITTNTIEITTPKVYTTSELVYDSYYGTDNKSKLEKEAESNLKKKIEKVELEINDLEVLLTPKKGSKGIIEGRAIDKYLDYKKTVEGMNPNESFYNARVNDLGRYRNIVKKYEKEKEEKQTLLKKLKAYLENDSIEEIAQKRILELQEQLNDLNFLIGTVVLVDDMAKEGWYSFYNAITGKTIELVNQELPDKKHKLNTLEVATAILAQTPNLVLLDMRLYEGEEDELYPSGIQILKELRKQNKIVPVIVCSASNRGSVINQIHQEGANFYWLKEGVDLEFSFDESINNYERLIHLFKTTLSANQVRIQELYNRFQNELVLSDNTFWWENKDWGYGHTVVNLGMTNSMKFVPIVSKVSNDYRLHQLVTFPLVSLSKHILSIDFENRQADWMLCSSALTDLSNTIEYIHRFDTLKENERLLLEEYEKKKLVIPNIDKRIITEGYINIDSGGVQINRKYGRNDVAGGELYEVRNTASHYAGAETLTLDDVFAFTEKLIEYLIKDNQAMNQIQYFEKNRMWYLDKDCTNIMNQS